MQLKQRKRGRFTGPTAVLFFRNRAEPRAAAARARSRPIDAPITERYTPAACAQLNWISCEARRGARQIDSSWILLFLLRAGTLVRLGPYDGITVLFSDITITAVCSLGCL